MGGRGTTGKTKLFTNIDAARNVPLREARAKEIEAERVSNSRILFDPRADARRTGRVGFKVTGVTQFGSRMGIGYVKESPFGKTFDARASLDPNRMDESYVRTKTGFATKEAAARWIGETVQREGNWSRILKD